MFNQATLMNMITRKLAEGFNQLPPEVQQSLQNTEVLILRQDNQIRIVCKSRSGDEEEARQVARGLGNAVIPLLARVIGGFQCQVKYQV
jgi:hypothetical protein